MSGAEFAVANATALAELRSSIGTAGTCLVWLFVACLGGWLVLGCIAAMNYISLKRHGLVIVIISVLLMSQIALAQPPHSVNSGRARLWSVGATVAPMVAGGGLLAVSHFSGSDNFIFLGLGVESIGLIFGPGAGYAYVGEWRLACSGTMIRLAATGLAVSGIGLWQFKENGNGTPVLFLTGGAMVLLSAIYDVVTVGKSVDEYNHKNGFANLHIVPTYCPSYQAPGLAIAMLF
jgi:hypothetical protein